MKISSRLEAVELKNMPYPIYPVFNPVFDPREVQAMKPLVSHRYCTRTRMRFTVNKVH